MSDWPPRFTITPEGIAGLFLRKHFGSTAGHEQQMELAGLLRWCVEQETTRLRAALEASQTWLHGHDNAEGQAERRRLNAELLRSNVRSEPETPGKEQR